MRPQGAALRRSREPSEHGLFDRVDAPTVVPLPALLQPRNFDREVRLTIYQIALVVIDDWEVRTHIWQKIRTLMAQRPRALIAEMESRRLARVMR
jgi:hypothetical protein